MSASREQTFFVVRTTRAGSNLARLGVCIGVAIVSVNCAAVLGRGSRAAEQRFVAEEVRSVVVNARALPSGAVVSDSGAVVVWATYPPAVLMLTDSGGTHLCAASLTRPIAAAWLNNASFVGIIDQRGDGGTLELLTASGRDCQRTNQTSWGAAELTAVGTHEGWVLAANPGQGGGDLVSIDTTGRVRWRRTLAAATDGRLTSVERILVSAAGNDVIISSIDPPFFSVLVGDSGGARLFLQAETRETGSSRWVGLRSLRVAPGFIQTLSDPRTDNRRLVLFDSEGTYVRSRDLDVALGFLASSPNGRYLVALRRTDVDEIVTYRVHGDARAPK